MEKNNSKDKNVAEEPKRMQLQEWFMANMPEMFYNEPATSQIMWVRDNLSYMIWNNGLIQPFIGDVKDTLTVDGTHRSKSILLPVYRFDVEGTTFWIRGNFYDWCLHCNKPLAKPFPEYLKRVQQQGFYEGMPKRSPLMLCVTSKEYLFATILWLLTEGCLLTPQ